MNTSLNFVDADKSLKLDVRAAIFMLPLLWIQMWFHRKVNQFKYKMIWDFSLLAVNMLYPPQVVQTTDVAKKIGTYYFTRWFSVQALGPARVRKQVDFMHEINYVQPQKAIIFLKPSFHNLEGSLPQPSPSQTATFIR